MNWRTRRDRVGLPRKPGCRLCQDIVLLAQLPVLAPQSGQLVLLKGRQTIVTAVIIGSNLSRALTGGALLLGTLSATTLLLGLHRILARGAERFRGVSRIIEGVPLRLAEAGKADRSMQHPGAGA